MNAGTRDVERELADGDAHAPRTLVSEAEDALVVGDDDEADVLVGKVAEPLGDAVDVVGREPDAPHVAHDVAEALTRLSNGGRVDDRHQLTHMLHQHAVEEDLVAMEERGETDVALELGALLVQMLELELDLLLDRLDRRGQQPMQAALLALLGSERQPLVRRRVLEQPDPALARLDAVGAAEAVGHGARALLRQPTPAALRRSAKPRSIARASAWRSGTRSQSPVNPHDNMPS
jgi:hypothetical protein